MSTPRKSQSASGVEGRTRAVTLSEFIREKKKKDCVICRLDVSIRRQLGPEASKRGFSRGDQVEWLREVVGITAVTGDVLQQHLNGRHDTAEELRDQAI